MAYSIALKIVEFNRTGPPGAAISREITESHIRGHRIALRYATAMKIGRLRLMVSIFEKIVEIFGWPNFFVLSDYETYKNYCFSCKYSQDVCILQNFAQIKSALGFFSIVLLHQKFQAAIQTDVYHDDSQGRGEQLLLQESYI